MDLDTIKLIGRKVSEIYFKQTEEIKIYSLYDNFGGQITLTFNRKYKNFNGHNYRVTEDFTGNYSNNILTFNTQNGKSISLTLSELIE